MVQVAQYRPRHPCGHHRREGFPKVVTLGDCAAGELGVNERMLDHLREVTEMILDHLPGVGDMARGCEPCASLVRVGAMKTFI